MLWHLGCNKKVTVGFFFESVWMLDVQVRHGQKWTAFKLFELLANHVIIIGGLGYDESNHDIRRAYEKS